MRVAVVGCLHGSLSELYETLPAVDLVLCCGDFQAVRNALDLDSLACPARYRRLGSFHEFYARPRDIPLTIVIGGNHEASNYMSELMYGGWLAENIYYLGAAGSVIVNGVRIAGVSGIYKKPIFPLGHFERVPYADHDGDIHSVCYLRLYEEQKLSLLRDVDIFLSHDWPVNITEFGDRAALLRTEPRFKGSITSGTFGAPSLARLVDAVRPRYWFAAHMHCKWPGVKLHPQQPNSVDHEHDPSSEAWLNALADGLQGRRANPNQAVPRPTSGATTQRSTRFLALSKPRPGTSDWWQVLDIPAPSSASPPTLSFDPAWLAITVVTHPLALFRNVTRLPDDLRARCDAAYAALDPRAHGPVSAVQVFAKTAPAEGNGEPEVHYTNPQTTAFCSMLGIEDLTNPAPGRPRQGPPPQRNRSGGGGRGNNHRGRG